MSKRPHSGTCVYCGERAEKLTRDHVFPKAWYPDSTSDSVQKWTVPACMSCNQRFKLIEDRLRHTIGLCTTETAEGSRGISERAARAIVPALANDARDGAARQSLRESIARRTSDISSLSKPDFLTGFGPDQPDRMHSTRAIEVAGSDIQIIAEKLTKGTTYCLDERLISDEYEIQVFQGDPLAFEEQILMATIFGTTHSLGPGLRIQRLAAADDPLCGFLILEIWGRMVLWVTTQRKHLVANCVT